MKIGIDFDDCLADYCKVLIDHYNKIDGTSYKIEDAITWDLGYLWGMDEKSAIDRCINFYPKEKGIEILPVYGAIEAINKLKKNELIIITGRPDTTLNFVVEWLQKHSINVFSKIIFSNQFNGEKRGKAEICKDEEVEVFIDDHLGNVINTSKTGIKCFLMDMPWNQGDIPSTVERVESWDEIVERINK